MSRWPDGMGRVILDSTDSTNAEAARRAADPGCAVPLWIMARRQTAGRGRQGRVWAAPEGNLSASLLMRPQIPAAEAAQLSFAACLAVADVLASTAPAAEVRLKWPNDAVLNGRKVAGVLLESSGRGRDIDWLVVGVGINLAQSPARDSIAPGTVAPSSVVAEGGAQIEPEEALDRLAFRFEHWRALHAAQGFAALRSAWLARASGLGQRIEARLPGRVVSGVYEDVDASGSLVLRNQTGPIRISAADLFFPE
jgi:BirA family biotin operon repressor/biotin-[acetyl-CoA-carboxylase] ligase